MDGGGLTAYQSTKGKGGDGWKVKDSVVYLGQQVSHMSVLRASSVQKLTEMHSMELPVQIVRVYFASRRDPIPM